MAKSPHRADDQEIITVVSGLPRSGTSMLMKMLDAGGIPSLVDGQRASDEDNPLGYFELERVKAMPKGDKEWVAEARGKAVKVISFLLEHLPGAHTYRVIFMSRSMPEILASQKKMLIRRGEPTDKVSDEELAGIYQKHLDKVQAWLDVQDNMSVLHVSYNAVLKDPVPNVEQIKRFLGDRLDAKRMAEVVEPSLYRQRS